MSSAKREEVITAICKRTGKSRDQAVAFLDILGSAFRRRGEIPGEPLTQEQIGERLDTFLGDTGGESPSVDELVGIDPNWTGGLTTEEYISRQRRGDTGGTE